MSTIEVRDSVIWPKHIRDNSALREELLALASGETVRLVVDGVAGTWQKMDDGKNGLPTPGIKPVGAARDQWRGLFETQRSSFVSITKAAT